ncbi:hypothetical protein GGR56DRAFT_400389 [Xylariaceae sp. FL0804]|nr:hypothetical protein GGR56DRAFT_400389 [Xylariaceae sp. FL0804]
MKLLKPGHGRGLGRGLHSPALFLPRLADASSPTRLEGVCFIPTSRFSLADTVLRRSISHPGPATPPYLPIIRYRYGITLSQVESDSFGLRSTSCAPRHHLCCCLNPQPTRYLFLFLARLGINGSARRPGRCSRNGSIADLYPSKWTSRSNLDFSSKLYLYISLCRILGNEACIHPSLLSFVHAFHPLASPG